MTLCQNYYILQMHSIATIKNKSWPRLIRPTLYGESPDLCICCHFSAVHHHHHFIRPESSTVCQTSEHFKNTMNKTYQLIISAYGSIPIVIGLEASKYGKTRYNKVISTVTHTHTHN